MKRNKPLLSPPAFQSASGTPMGSSCKELTAEQKCVLQSPSSGTKKQSMEGEV